MQTRTVQVGDVLSRFRDALAETHFCAQTNQTTFPASWVYGRAAGDASTSDYYECRKSRAAQHVLAELAKEHDVTAPDCVEDWDEMGSRDIARAIADAINEAIARDAEAEAKSD
jgi:hypothetical protein